MKKLKVSMLGAGSGFVLSIAKELNCYDIFTDCQFVMMDINQNNLDLAQQQVMELLGNNINNVTVTTTTSLTTALDGCDYVISSCEKSRYPNWVKDFQIPENHGVHQLKAENGGPGGIIHGMRNISMFMGILKQMERLCPDALLLNFTNPMSILCTYFNRYSPIRNIGFCHQVHGSFGVIAEMLGFEPGELEVISAGVNHLNWLFDVRRKNSNKSYMKEFLDGVGSSQYWHKKFPNIPPQKFTLEVLKTFNMYPIGYDDHISEYMPFFWEESEWAEFGYESLKESYIKLSTQQGSSTLETIKLLGSDYEQPPFPVDDTHPYYSEAPCKVIMALETNTPTYFDAVVVPNNGAVDNLPQNATLDVPAVVIGGEARSIHVGELPIGPMEICRRQISIHEMIAQATHEGDESLAVQAFALDPYVRSITQARNIWQDFKKEYQSDLPTFS